MVGVLLVAVTIGLVSGAVLDTVAVLAVVAAVLTPGSCSDNTSSRLDFTWTLDIDNGIFGDRESTH